LLRDCDPDIVGTFETTQIEENHSEMENPTVRLEDFRVPVSSVWRSVNGGSCETAQKYLSNKVATCEKFLDTFDTFVTEMILPDVKARLVACGALESESAPCAFYYQRPPTLRLQPGPGKLFASHLLDYFVILEELDSSGCSHPFFFSRHDINGKKQDGLRSDHITMSSMGIKMGS